MRALIARDFSGASHAYAQCSNAKERQQCSVRAAGIAPKAAENAAFNQKCDEAKAIMTAARALGVSEGRLASARTTCK